MKSLKFIMILIIFTIMSFLLLNVYKYFDNRPKNGTGAMKTIQNVEELNEAKAINLLIKSVPIKLDDFEIYEYSYSEGKFLVKYYGDEIDVIQIKEDFDKTVNDTELYIIRKSMFKIGNIN